MMSIAVTLKNLIGRAHFAFPWGRRALSRRGVVLMLHRVLASEHEAAWPHRRGMCIGRESFAQLLDWLRQHFDCVPLEQLLAQPAGVRPRVALTFDDGWRDNFELAFPLLQQHGIPASIFLSTGLIGDAAQPSRNFWWEIISDTLWRAPQSPAARRLLEALRAIGAPAPRLLLQDEASHRRSRLLASYLMMLIRLPAAKLQAIADALPVTQTSHALDWEQVRDMEDSGLVRFGPHSVSHAILTTLDDASLRAELADSHAALQAHCRQPLPVYCYPYGIHDERVRQAVAELGYRYALASQRGLLGPDSERLALPRINVGGHAYLAWRLFRGAWAC
ncbi:MAG: polysaccharide deacetylase family protein [Zoogloeaceae bacterium]|jgi:peptidoglycan/xylan/chitin deacetylase (PgdA/CDA1 family)|nr:polysaccharide deacetylase family protein [Zoogloeaceae bacterium]